MEMKLFCSQLLHGGVKNYLQYKNRTIFKNKKPQQVDLQKVEVLGGGERGTTLMQNYHTAKALFYSKSINNINILNLFHVNKFFYLVCNKLH